ncbi:MAG: TolC family outer membrane protein [Gammaproteobacteria bacterium]|nr:TolC family outer membrane protein [Gammaproteobacteria bacterium]
MRKTSARLVCASLAVVLFSTGLRAETLLEIYDLAMGNAPQLKAAEATFKVGQEALPQARAGLLPTITGTVGLEEGRGIQNNSRVLGADFLSQSIGDYHDATEAYRLSLTQPVFDLPAWFNFQRGKDLDQRAAAQFAADQQRIVLDVTDAYFGVLRANENLTSAEAEERAIGRQLEQTKERFDVGLLPITDVHEAQAAFDGATVNTLEAKSALDIAFEALEVLTGKPHEQITGLARDFPITKPEPIDRESWVQFAQTNNFALRVARLDVDAADKAATAARAEHLPKVTASLDYQKSLNDGTLHRDGGLLNQQGTLDPAASQPFVNDQESTVLGLHLTAPRYCGGAASSRERQAYQERIRSQENYVLAQRPTTQRARSQHLQVLTDAARINARAQAITSAQSALDATQAGYEVGTRNIVDVLISQRLLYREQRDYANARFDYINSMLRLKEVAGQLSPGDVEQLNRWLDAGLMVGKAVR